MKFYKKETYVLNKRGHNLEVVKVSNGYMANIIVGTSALTLLPDGRWSWDGNHVFSDRQEIISSLRKVNEEELDNIITPWPWMAF